MNYLTFYEWDYDQFGMQIRIISGFNTAYDELINRYYSKYFLRLDVSKWCVENVGRVDLEQDGIVCRLTFESDGAAILFAMHFNVEFALCN